MNSITKAWLYEVLESWNSTYDDLGVKTSLDAILPKLKKKRTVLSKNDYDEILFHLMQKFQE